jgi:competence protein ComEC
LIGQVFFATYSMIQTSGIIVCLGYILGLLFTAVPWGGFWVLLIGLVGAVLFGRRTPTPAKPLERMRKSSVKTNTARQMLPTVPKPRVWVIAGAVGLLASLYFQLWIPQPGANDISKFVPSENSNNFEQLFIVQGEVTSTPRLTRNHRGQFWLQANQLGEVKKDNGSITATKGVTGKLYVTVPLLQATGLYPGQQIAVTGILYKPKPSFNPGSFNFQKFLEQEGAFAGLSGRQINILDEERKWGWWQVREQIVQSQARWLGVPEGPFVSAMVLGSKVVDLPYYIRDWFWRVGLAHALAASGFQTSLILAVVLGLTSKATRRTQLILGSAALLIFLSLTGFLPPVVRAVIMGFAALIGIGLQRKVNQLGSLLLAAVVMLLFNPLWIWDLAFQLSFLSTLGLIVTVPPITQRIQWLPSAMAHAIAVPLAGMIWTLPLLLHMFGVIPIYSLLVNIISAPFISIISLSGMISALASLILPDVGSVLASLVYYPTHILIKVVEFFVNLPGNSVALGSISTVQMLVIYTLIILAWLVPWWQKRWWFTGLISMSIVLLPVWHSANTLFRVTILATGGEPVMIIQDHGKVTVINSGDEGTGRYVILPFLQQQGINKIGSAIAFDLQTNNSNSWLEILQRLPVQFFYDYSPTFENAISKIAIQKELVKTKGVYQPLSVGQTVSTGSVFVQLINDQVPIVQMQIQGQNWLLVGNLKPNELRQVLTKVGLPRPQVLWCPSQSLQELIPILQPQVAISNSANYDSDNLATLKHSQTKVFFTGLDGAVQWTPTGEFETFVQATENKLSVF